MKEKNKRMTLIASALFILILFFSIGKPSVQLINETQATKATVTQPQNEWVTDELKINSTTPLNFATSEMQISLPSRNNNEKYFFSINGAEGSVSTLKLNSLFTLFRDNKSRLTTINSSPKTSAAISYKKITTSFKKASKASFKNLTKDIIRAAGYKASKAALSDKTPDGEFYVSSKGHLALRLLNGKFKNIAFINKNLGKNFQPLIKMNFVEPLQVTIEEEGKAVVSTNGTSLYEKVDFFAGVGPADTKSPISGTIYQAARIDLRNIEIETNI